MPDGVLLNLHLPPDDIRIDTDAQHLRQVMENLIGNAVKFTTEGYIEIGCSRTGDGNGVRLFVADTGPGIAAQMRERIFDPVLQNRRFQAGCGFGAFGLQNDYRRYGRTDRGLFPAGHGFAVHGGDSQYTVTNQSSSRPV